METATKFTKLDEMYAKAYESIIGIQYELSQRKDNQTQENKVLLNAAIQNAVNNLEGLREFDR